MASTLHGGATEMKFLPPVKIWQTWIYKISPMMTHVQYTQHTDPPSHTHCLPAPIHSWSTHCLPALVHSWITHCLPAPIHSWSTHCLPAPVHSWITHCLPVPVHSWSTHCLPALVHSWITHCLPAPYITPNFIIRRTAVLTIGVQCTFCAKAAPIAIS